MRISTSQIFQQGIDAMLKQQRELTETELQVATGMISEGKFDYRPDIRNKDELGDRLLVAVGRKPYTEGLLASIPRLSRRVDSLKGIKGSIPSFIDPPRGCRFHPRCGHAMSVCRKEKPFLEETSPGHRTACFLYQSSWPKTSQPGEVSVG